MSNLIICGPLFQLRWFGTICPCLEKAEDTPAREALIALGNSKVQWHRTAKDNNNKSTGAGFLGMFHKTSNKNGTSSSSSSKSVEAVLDFYDSLRGPEIHITPCSCSPAAAADESNHNNGGEITMKQSAGFKKIIPLKQVDKVVATSSTGSGWGGGSSASASASTIVLQSETNGHTEILVRLSLLSGNNENGTTTTGWDVVQLNNQRTQVIEHWTHLIEWDGRRRSALVAGEEEEEEEDEFDAGLKHRAQTAAHFAKREIELRQHKRERDERKARYIKQAGGLKYTALAMANRAEEE